MQIRSGSNSDAHNEPDSAEIRHTRLAWLYDATYVGGEISS